MVVSVTCLVANGAPYYEGAGERLRLPGAGWGAPGAWLGLDPERARGWGWPGNGAGPGMGLARDWGWPGRGRTIITACVTCNDWGLD